MVTFMATFTLALGRIGLVLTVGVMALCLLPSVAVARKPVIAYVDDTTGKLKLYDAETAAEAAAPDLTIPLVGVFRIFAVSHDGRYVAWLDSAEKIHLFDRSTAAEVALPGIDVDPDPRSLAVSNDGRIAFDNNVNGLARVYDSASGSFVDTGFPVGATGHRQTRLSGDGRLLATTCITGAGKCVVDSDTNSDVDAYVQRLTPAPPADTGFPDNLSGAANRGEEHPCIDGDGSIVGVDIVVGANKIDLFLFDRTAGQVLNIPELKNPAVNEVNCILDAGGDYVGLNDQVNGGFKLFERSSKLFVPLPDAVKNQSGFGRHWLTAPYTPPPPPPPPPDPPDDPPPDVTPPFLGAVSVSNPRFRVGAPAAAVGRAPRGTRFRYTLSEPAGMRITIERATTGRRVGTRCLRPTRALRGRRPCVRYLGRGSFGAFGAAGPNSTPFSGRVAGKALAPGRYRALLRATDAAGNRSRQRSATFRIVRR